MSYKGPFDGNNDNANTPSSYGGNNSNGGAGKNIGRAALILLAIVAVVYGIYSYTSDKPELAAANKTENVSSTQKGDDTQPSSSFAESKEHSSFGYTPEDPVNGTLKGVVELGASGFNSFVVNIDAQKRWKVISKDFGQSFAYENMATTEDIRAGLKKYIGNMFDRGVSNKNMHFVVSSGAQKAEKTGTIISELKKMGYVVNLVTPEQEGKLALRCIQPPSYKESSFVVDIGSGNTKISWYENGSLKALEGLGAKYYEKKESDATITDESVYSDINRKAGTIPKARQEVCFIVGGVPYEMAKEARQGEERYTVLYNPDAYNSDKAKVKAGVNIYKAIKDATGCDTFVFDWDSNFTIGFLLTLP